MPTSSFIELIHVDPTATVAESLKNAPAAAQAAIKNALDANLKTQLKAMLTSTPVLAGLVENMAQPDFAAAKDLTVQTFVKQQLDPMVAADPEMQKAVDGEIAKVNVKGTIGALLGLDKPLQSNPLFHNEIKKANLAGMLATSPALAPNQQLIADFADAYASSTGTNQEFWQSISTNSEFASALPELQVTLQLGTLTQNNAAAVSAIRSKYNISTLRGLADVTDTAQLTDLIVADKVPVPPSINDGTAANYAVSMIKQLTAAFPTDFVAKGLKASTDPLNQDVATVLQNSPDIDLRTTNIDSYLSAHSTTAFSGIEPGQTTNVQNRLKAVQRIFRVNPDANTIQTLLSAGLDSARKIAATPRASFMRRYGPSLNGQASAQQVYTAAQQISGMVSHLYRNITDGLVGRNPFAVGNPTAAVQAVLEANIPNWQTLFGSTSSCECQECTALDGPAAYFVDLLQFLSYGSSGSTSTTVNAAGYTPLDVLIGYNNNPNNYTWTPTSGTATKSSQPKLPPTGNPPLGRRPDLAYLQLTCANSDTSLPYVDLINEILEAYVYYVGLSNFTDLPPWSAQNTSPDATSAELNANPDNIIHQVYDPPATASGPPTLATAPYPLSLPYDRYLDTARVYLNNVGVSRAQIIESFTLPFSTVDEQVQLALEVLNSNDFEYNLITQKDELTYPSIASQYGFPVAPYVTASIILGSAASSWSVSVVDSGSNPNLIFNNTPSVGDTVMLTVAYGPSVSLKIPVTNPTTAIQDVVTAVTGDAALQNVSISASTPDANQIAITASNLSWMESLAVVQTFLNQTDITFNELVALLETQYLNASQSILLQANPADPCDITTMLLVGPPTAVGGIRTLSPLYLFYAALPAFLRLKHRLGWTISELDKAIMAINGLISTPPGAIMTGRSFVLAASQIKTLQGLLNLSVTQLLSLWTNIDADGRDSLYVQLFQNKAVTSPLDPAFALAYQAPLTTVPSPPPKYWSDGTPQTLASWADGQLFFVGTMTEAQHDDLLAWGTGNAPALLAVDNLYNERWTAGTDINIPETIHGPNPPLLCQHVNTILAALQVSASDLSAIAGDCGLAPPSADLNAFTWAAIGGTVTPNDTITLTLSRNVENVVLPAVSVSYPAKAGDTLGSIASSLAVAINATLQADGISATAQGAVINLFLASSLVGPGITLTWGSTITSGTSGASATETVTFTNCPPLSIARLSSLYRFALLTQALNVTVTELIALKTLSGINPFNLGSGGKYSAALPIVLTPLGELPDSPTNPTVQFVHAAQAVASSTFSIEQLNYIYRAIPDAIDGLPATLADQQELLVALSSGLQKIAAANAFSPDPSGTALRKKLATILPADQVEPAMGLIAGTAAYISSHTFSSESAPARGDMPYGQPPSAATLADVSNSDVSYFTNVTLTGSPTQNDTVELQLNLSGVSGSPFTLSHIVLADDTLHDIATDLVAQLNADQVISAAGISATETSNATEELIVVSSELVLSPSLTSNALTVPAATTETLTIATAGTSTTITFGGAITQNDTLTLALTSNALTGPPVILSYTVAENDNLANIATQFVTQINTTALNAAGIVATGPSSATNPVVTISGQPSLRPATTEALAIDAAAGGTSTTVTLSGAVSPGDVLALSLASSAFAGSPVLVSHPVGDTLSWIANGLASQITSNATMQGVGVSATALGPVITITVPQSIAGSLTWTPGTGTTEQLNVAVGSPGSPTLVTVSGTITPNDVVTLTAQISGSSPVPFTHDVVGDTLASIATSIATQINANSVLNAAGISASGPTSTPAPVITITNPMSLSPGQTWTPITTPASGNAPASETLAIAAPVLQCTGPMSATTQVDLNSLTTASDFLAAVTDLYNQAQTIVTQDLSFLAPAAVYSAPIGPTLPSGFTVPPCPPGQVEVVASESSSGSWSLRCYGPMTSATETELSGIGNALLTTVTGILYQQAWLNASRYLIDVSSSSTPAERYNYVLQALLSYLQTVQSQQLVVQTLSQAVGLRPAMTAALLEDDPIARTMALLPSQSLPESLLGSQPAQPAIRDFLGGLLGIYFHADSLAGSPTLQIDPGVSTVALFGSVQWLGQVIPPTTDAYTFSVSTASGVPLVLWVDETKLIDTTGESPPAASPTITLQAGQPYEIQLSCLNVPLEAPIQLQWSSGSMAQTTIPAAALIPGAAPTAVSPESGSFALGGAYATLSLLYRIAVIINGFSMQTEDIAYLSAHGDDFSGISPSGSTTTPFDLSALPIDYYPVPPNLDAANPKQQTIDAEAPALFNQWQRLVSIYQLKSSLPSRSNVGLFDIFQAASNPSNPPGSVSPTVANTILQASNWNATDFQTLTGASGFVLSDSSFVNEICLLRLASCLALASHIGAASQSLLQWAANSPDATQAQDIVMAVKSGYSDVAWGQVGPTLANQIREHSKDALIAYILTMAPIVSAGFTTPDDLYDYFLIDVSMTTCMQTSRLVQATAAVQQFTQRCLLNLEYDSENPNDPFSVAPSAIDANEWETWRKNYRIWQAAVQVFLFPENWIDPTLRDDRTPFFQDLQNQLLQASVTADNVEAAYLNYLDELQNVARLEIVGLYVEKTCGIDPFTGLSALNTPVKTHVIGRTPAQPYTYYYRYLDQTNPPQFVWSAWEKIGLDIKDAAVIPVVLNGRLFLFWPRFAQSPVSATNVDPNLLYNLQVINSYLNENDLVVPLFAGGLFGFPLTSPQATAIQNIVDSAVQTDPTSSVLNQLQTQIIQVNEDFIYGNSAFNDFLAFVLTLQSALQGLSPNATPGSSQPTLPPILSMTIQFAWSEYRSGQWTKAKLSDSLPLPYFTAYQQLTVDQFNWRFTDSHQVGLITPSEPSSVFILGGAPQTSQTYVLPTFANNFLFEAEGDWGGVCPSTTFGTSLSITVSCICKEISIDQNNPGYQLALSQSLLNIVEFSFDCTTVQEVSTVASISPWPSGYDTDDNTSDVFASSLSITVPSLDWFEEPPQVVLGQIPPPLSANSATFTLSAPADAVGWEAAYSEGFYLTTVEPLFYADSSRTFFMSVVPFTYLPQSSGAEQVSTFSQGPWPEPYQVLVQNHYHPWINRFIQTLNSGDIPSLLDISTQELGSPLLDPVLSDQFNFAATYVPSTAVAPPPPVEVVDTSAVGAYSTYNWELFFHIPLLIATQLSSNQQFEDAQTWFQYIFNPTSDASANSSGSPVPSPNRYWNFLFFRETTQDGQIQDLLNALAQPETSSNTDAYNHVTQWQMDPFDPDLIARVRPVAYEKVVVMKYLDNLIAWGDYLFAQNTRESINEATQLYVLASKVLGPKPVMVTQQGTVLAKAYIDLEWGSLDNSMVQLENALPFALSGTPGASNSSASSIPHGVGAVSTGAVPYFCTPTNTQLLGYWDTVADRLYKIRHCVNIQGQIQQLPLFAPPINPALLVAAEAAGVDLSSVLSDINAAVPYYRFSYVFAKALELCAEVRGLGSALLSALEKNDAEALGLLRASQEVSVQNAVLTIKQAQINEANDTLQGLQQSLAVTAYRQWYYQYLISNFPSPQENAQVAALTSSQIFKDQSQQSEVQASIVSLLPNMEIGISGAMGSPVSTFTFGGSQLAAVEGAVARMYSAMADDFSYLATMAGLTGGWNRRSQDWSFQLQTANLEITQINQQIAAAQVRLQIAQDDVQNQQLLISNAQVVQEFLSNKFTNEQMYGWMIDQVSALYFQCYQMAYDLAKRAETCYRFELGLAASSYIQFGYWDSLKQGLLSGEKLYLDLKRLESAYMDQNKREYEITRNISLLLLDPIALITLKETGQCIVSVPEAFFDMDYPGHYMRRLKTISLTIPCVTGPYTSVNCTLTLVQNKIRWDSSGSSSHYAENPVGSDPRFLYNFAATQSIATSTAQNDSGMFELNFRDERYLPFEGAGAISTWQLTMPQTCNAFDFETITDVIFNLKYTARDGGTALGAVALAAAVLPRPPQQQGATSPLQAPKKQPNLTRFFSLKHEFPTEWYQFMNPAASSNTQVMSLALTSERFPFHYRGSKITISQVELVLQLSAVYPLSPDSSTPLSDFGSSALAVTLTRPSASSSSSGSFVSTDGVVGGAPYASISTVSAPLSTVSGSQLLLWTMTINQSDVENLAPSLWNPATGFLNPMIVNDIYFVAHYSAQ